MQSTYDEAYFQWQRRVGEFGAIVDRFKFDKFIKPSDCVIDFGCGGGYMLKALTCADKIGIEVNDVARQFALKNGIRTVKDAAEIEDEWADVIVSDNALEHTLCPFIELRKLFGKLKTGGRMVFVVPHEKRNPWKENDRNQHLYTWSPMCAGNLFTAAGFKVDEISSIALWPPFHDTIKKYLGLKLFYLIGKICTALSGKWYQIRVVATKPIRSGNKTT
jgi:SAM-dependent methyltransferase